MEPDRLNVLIKLLDDPDELVFQNVARQFLKEDISIVRQLERVWETSLDELVQARLETIIQQIQFKHTNTKIKNWATQNHIDLFEGFFLISQYQYPGLRLKDIDDKINHISDDVMYMTDSRMTSVEKIAAFNHVLFDKYRFRISFSNFQPENCYINNLLETRVGTPVSITILYILIARKLDFDVQYIDFPKTPLLAYKDPKISTPVFYINPSNKGTIIGRKEIDFFMKRNNETFINFDDNCKDKIIIKKLIVGLIDAYSILGNLEKVSSLKSIASSL